MFLLLAQHFWPGENCTQQYLVLLLRHQAEGQYPAVSFIRALCCYAACVSL